VTAPAEPADEEVPGRASQLAGGIDDLLVGRDRAALGRAGALVADAGFARDEHTPIGGVLELAAVADETGQPGARAGCGAVRAEIRGSAQALVPVDVSQEADRVSGLARRRRSILDEIGVDALAVRLNGLRGHCYGRRAGGQHGHSKSPPTPLIHDDPPWSMRCEAGF
jgi:hypothetical protein